MDEAIIEVAGGDGGKGCVGWRREKYVPRGGPAGGDGGRGGNVIIVADANADTLSDFTSRKKFEAPSGTMGGGSNCGGADADDLILLVPPGTSISEVDPLDRTKRTLLVDLKDNGDQYIAAYGGRGGFGNAHFVSSTRQRPDFAELGEPGDRKTIMLELKLVADVGIIGYPSVGKSTLISVISAARPKIAAYPFTTLIPNLGVVNLGERQYVVCDVPGLIEGASEGKGLGDKFLKHIERCGVLLHLLDIGRALGAENEVNIDQLVADYKAIRHELVAYSPALGDKRELVILNKTDLVPDQIDDIVKKLKKKKISIFATISAATKQGTQELTQLLLPIVLEERTGREKLADDVEEAAAKELPVLRPQQDSIKMGAYKVHQRQDGIIIVSGKRIEQFTKMTNFEVAGGQDRFRDVISRINLDKAIKHLRKGDHADAPVYIGTVRVDEYL